MDVCCVVVCCLQLYVCCCLVWTSDGHTVDYYETVYPELFKRDHRKLYSSIDHRKYFCNCDMQKGDEASLDGSPLHTKTLASSLANKAVVVESNKTDIRVVELDESQMDELLKQGSSSDPKSKRTVQHVYLVVSLGGLLAVVILTVVFVVCLVWRRIQRKSSSTSDSSVRLQHHLQHLQHQLSSSQHPHKQHQQQQPSHPQATHQLHHRSVVVSSPLGTGDYKITDLRCCQKDGDDHFYPPAAYGYNFCLSKQRLALDSGKTKHAAAETKIQWSDAPEMEKTSVKSNCKAIASANDNPIVDSRSSSRNIPASVHLRGEDDETESIAQFENEVVRQSSYYRSFDSSEKVLLEAKK